MPCAIGEGLRKKRTGSEIARSHFDLDPVGGALYEPLRQQTIPENSLRRAEIYSCSEIRTKTAYHVTNLLELSG